MRITSGTRRGFLIRGATSGPEVRPTSALVREALFAILGERIDGALVLDLFAGSGALGIEALSRGASKCVFVEKSPQAVRLIRQNLEKTRFKEQAIVICSDIFRSSGRIRSLSLPFQIVLIDPPYRMSERIAPGEKIFDLLVRLAGEEILAEGGLLVLQHDRRSQVAEVIPLYGRADRRTYGDTTLTFLRRDSSGG